VTESLSGALVDLFKFRQRADGVSAVLVPSTAAIAANDSAVTVRLRLPQRALDIAKRVFQVHGVDAAGALVFRKKLRRRNCQRSLLVFHLIGIEACATAHPWAREFIALGHQVRLVPPSYVKAFLKRGKNDAADAEAICEAGARPNMRFVPVKSIEQQGVLVLHRGRELLVRQRTMLVNGLRAHMQSAQYR